GPARTDSPPHWGDIGLLTFLKGGAFRRWPPKGARERGRRVVSNCSSLKPPVRPAERSSSCESPQEPPRTTRPLQFPSSQAEPSAGARAVYSGCQQSATHSATLPCMSCSPNAFGAKLPTGSVVCRLTSEGPE